LPGRSGISPQPFTARSHEPGHKISDFSMTEQQNPPKTADGDRVFISTPLCRDGEQCPALDDFRGKAGSRRLLTPWASTIIEAAFPSPRRAISTPCRKLQKGEKTPPSPACRAPRRKTSTAAPRRSNMRVFRASTLLSALRRCICSINCRWCRKKVLELIASSVSRRKKPCRIRRMVAEDGTRPSTTFCAARWRRRSTPARRRSIFRHGWLYDAGRISRFVRNGARARAPMPTRRFSPSIAITIWHAVANSIAGVQGGARQIDVRSMASANAPAMRRWRNRHGPAHRADVLPYKNRIETTLLTRPRNWFRRHVFPGAI